MDLTELVVFTYSYDGCAFKLAGLSADTPPSLAHDREWVQGYR